MEIKAILDFLSGDEWWKIGATGAIVLSILIAAISYAIIKLTSAIISTNELMKTISKQAANDYTPHVYMDVNVSSLLTLIRRQTYADRVSVYQYHNGEKDIANNRFLKISCTHENISSNVNSVQKYMENIPTAMFGNWNTHIFEKQHVFVKDVNNLEKMGELRAAYQLLSNNHTSSTYLYPLTTPLGKVFGFGIIEYCRTGSEKTGQTIDEKLDDWLGKEFNSVGTLLSQSTVDENTEHYKSKSGKKYY
jgi:hypothetical protein